LGWGFTFYGAAALGVFAAVSALVLMRIPKPVLKPAPVIVRAGSRTEC